MTEHTQRQKIAKAYLIESRKQFDRAVQAQRTYVNLAQKYGVSVEEIENALGRTVEEVQGGEQ